MPRVRNGRLEPGTGRFGARAGLQCDPGYRPRPGLPTFTCTATARWEGEAECEPVLCPLLAAPPQGAVVHRPAQKDGVGWQATAQFSCLPGHQLVGATNSTCLHTGAWSEAVPQCQRVWCPPLHPTQHTFMMGVGRQFGDVVRFACEEGHRMFGEREVSCLAAGEWDGPPPACHRVWCETPLLQHGLQLPAEPAPLYPHRTRLELACRPGHAARGSLMIECQAHGRWSRPEGACHSELYRYKCVSIFDFNLRRSELRPAETGARGLPLVQHLRLRVQGRLQLPVRPVPRQLSAPLL